MKSRTWLQRLLTILGIVMVVAGVAGVLFGVSSLPREGAFTADVDSEFRFFAVWYVAAGVLLLRAVSRVERETFTVRAIAAAFFAAGLARAVSFVVVGTPHASQIVLMVVELVLPFVIVPWQAAVANEVKS